MSDKNDFGAFLIGFIVGGLTGAAVSLIFAPQSGEETRHYIQDKAIELRDLTSESVEEARLKAEKAWDVAKEKTEEWSQLAKEKADELKTMGEQTISEGKEKIIETLHPKDKSATEEA